MKKILSVLLALVMIFSLAMPAFATRATVKAGVPVIYISGDSNRIYYDNETKSFAIEDVFEIFSEDDSEEGSVKEAVLNIMYPFIVKGILTDNWDDYYEAFYKELNDKFEPVKLDENGNVHNDSGISSEQKADLLNAMTYDRADKNGQYQEDTYKFHYDWRLDPIELADQLHEYIEGVKKASGHDKVGISVRCLGCNVVLAYINKYGTDSLKGVGIDVSTSMGADFLSGMVSGDFGIDGNAISRIIVDLAERDKKYSEVLQFATATIDLLSNTGVIGTLSKVAREQLYSKIEYGVISAISRATFLTYPCYWALITTEDFDSALNYVFGFPGDEKRETYKGLIEKITNYNETIKKNVTPIVKQIEDNGVNLCVVSKYGIQMAPTLKDGSILGDEYVSAARSSFGATTSTVYDTLSEKYIKAQTEKGLERYISPDKKVDASTCLFPDYTWFFKGVPHGYYTREETDLIMTVIDADIQLTVNDYPLTQFISYDFPNRTAYPMTEENCSNENWVADEKTDRPKTEDEKLTSFIRSILNWLRAVFNLFTSLIKK